MHTCLIIVDSAATNWYSFLEGVWVFLTWYIFDINQIMIRTKWCNVYFTISSEITKRVGCMAGELRTYQEEMYPKWTDSSTELSVSTTLNFVPQTIECHPNGYITITFASISLINALNLNCTMSKVLHTSNLLQSRRFSQHRLLNTHPGDR